MGFEPNIQWITNSPSGFKPNSKLIHVFDASIHNLPSSVSFLESVFRENSRELTKLTAVKKMKALKLRYGPRVWSTLGSVIAIAELPFQPLFRFWFHHLRTLAIFHDFLIHSSSTKLAFFRFSYYVYEGLQFQLLVLFSTVFGCRESWGK